MKKAMAILWGTLALVSMVFCSGALGDKIYKWVDEKGVAHYSDHQPDDPATPKGTVEEREIQGPSPVKGNTQQAVPPATRSPIEYATRCTFIIRGSRSMGTGFFINSNGYAATASHVVADDLNHVAVLGDRGEFPVKIISVIEEEDLALLLLLNIGNTPFLPLRSPDTLVPGERVFAIGASAGLQATVTDGVFTGIRNIQDTTQQVLQFSAPINPGNSGGPLIDEEGKVVGVISKKYLMQKGIPIAGVGFAVPSTYVKEAFGSYLEQ